MDDFDLFGDYEPERPATLEEERPQRERRRRKRQPLTIYDLVSLFFLAATGGVIAITVILIQNPTVPFNPFPPPAPQPTPTLFLLNDTGEVGGQLPPTWTPSPLPTDVPTSTPRATATQTPTPRPTATGMAQPGATHTLSLYPFTLQNEAVTYTQNPNEQGCAWMSIAGQVFDLNGEPRKNLPILVTGDDFGDAIAWSGSAPQWGESGYEVFLNSTPYEAEFGVQLLNTTGMPLSEVIVVRTLSSCDHNVAIVNFVQNHELPR